LEKTSGMANCSGKLICFQVTEESFLLLNQCFKSRWTSKWESRWAYNDHGALALMQR
jgi:hypothetical protein